MSHHLSTPTLQVFDDTSQEHVQLVCKVWVHSLSFDQAFEGLFVILELVNEVLQIVSVVVDSIPSTILSSIVKVNIAVSQFLNDQTSHFTPHMYRSIHYLANLCKVLSTKDLP